MRKFLIFIVTFAISLSISNPTSAVQLDETKDKWLVYWYISGSNLESEYNQATNDMREVEDAIQRVDLDLANDRVNADKAAEYKHNFKAIRNIKFLVQTGGATKWHNDRSPTETVGRYIYDSDGWHYQGAFPDVDMGSTKGLADFLRYGKEQVEPIFKPDHRIFIFWDHGDFLSVCYDYRHEDEGEEFIPSALDLNEIRDAFNQVFSNASPDNPPFEIIGFDACYRATYENANNLYGFTRYMIASQEQESGFGWYYTDWINAIAQNPSITGRELGKIICDGAFGYIQTQDFNRLSDYERKKDSVDKDVEPPNQESLAATFSLIDLSRPSWENLRKSYDEFGNALIKMSNKYPESCSAIFRAASGLHYNEDGGTAQLLDLRRFAEKILENLPDDIDNSTRSQITNAFDNLTKAIDSSVVHNRVGENTQRSHGLSVYYPSSFGYVNQEKFALYNSQKTTPKVIKKLVGNFMNDKWREKNNIPSSISSSMETDSNDTYQTSESRSISKPELRDRSGKNSQFRKSLQDYALNNLPILIEENDSVSLQLTKEQLKSLKRVECAVVLTERDMSDIFGDKNDEAISNLLDENEKAGDLVYLGFSSDIHYDVKHGYFSSKSKNTWLSLDGHLVFSRIYDIQPDVKDSNGNVTKWGYTNYGIPILVNGVLHTLKVSCQHSDRKYIIIGAQVDNGQVSKSGRSIRGFANVKAGDLITPIFHTVYTNMDDLDFSKENFMDDVSHDMKFVRGKSFTLSSNPQIEEIPLPDGNYACLFVLTDLFDKYKQSKFAGFQILNGQIQKFDYASMPSPELLDYMLREIKQKNELEKKYKAGEISEQEYDDYGANFDEEFKSRLMLELEKQEQSEIERRKQIRENWNKKK